MKVKKQIIESIKTIVENGGQVRYTYKSSIEEHVGLIGLFFSNYSNCYVLDSEFSHSLKFLSLDEAVNEFANRVFTKNNLALAVNGFHKYKMSNKSIDNLNQQEMLDVFEQYFEKYFKKDYYD